MGSALKGQDLCSSEFNSRIGMHEFKVPEYIGQLRLIFNLTKENRRALRVKKNGIELF